MHKSRNILSKRLMKQLYFSFSHSYLNYANVAWASTNKSNAISLYCHQKHAIRIIYDKDRFTHTEVTKLRNHVGELFLCPPQKQAKRQPTCQTAIFQAKFTSWPIKLITYIQEIKFTSHKLHLFGLLLFIEVKEDLYTSSFFNQSESKQLTNLQRQQLQKSFSPVCMLQMQLASMNVSCSMW